MAFPLTSPLLTTAHLTTPHNTSQHLTSAHFSSLQLTSRHVTTPLRPSFGPVFYGSESTFSLFHFFSVSLLSSPLFSSLLTIFAPKTGPDPLQTPLKSGPKIDFLSDPPPPWTALFAKGAQDPLKTRQRAPQSRPRRAQERPKTRQDGPRPLQDRTKTAQDRPKTAPRRPKTVPRPPEDAPRSPQDRPKTPQDPPRRPYHLTTPHNTTLSSVFFSSRLFSSLPLLFASLPLPLPLPLLFSSLLFSSERL